MIPPLSLTIDLTTLGLSFTKRVTTSAVKSAANLFKNNGTESPSLEDVVSQDNSKEVTVIINAHKREKTIERSIREMYGLGYPLKNMYISDSAGLDKTKEVVNRLKEEFPNLHYWSRQGVTAKSEKINLLARDPEVELGEYVYLKDSSAVPHEGLIKKLVEGFENDKKGDLAALTTYGYVTPTKSISANFFHYGKEWVNRMGQFRKTAQQKRRGMFVLCGASFMVKGEVLKKVEIPIGTQTEDTAYTWRLQKEGYRVGVVQDAVVHAEDVSSLNSQLKQSYRWYSGTWQNLFLNAKHLFNPFSKAAPLGYSTILPGFVEATIYCGTVISLPVISYFSPDLVKFFAIGDTTLTFLAPFISLPLAGRTKEIPKEIINTVIHYPQITAYKAMASGLWIYSGLKAGADVLTGKSKEWKGTWKKVY